MQFPVCIEGHWIQWTPPVSFIYAVGQNAAWIGAAVYGRAIHNGASEGAAQQEAEQAAYCAALRVKYM